MLSIKELSIKPAIHSQSAIEAPLGCHTYCIFQIPKTHFFMHQHFFTFTIFAENPFDIDYISLLLK